MRAVHGVGWLVFSFLVWSVGSVAHAAGLEAQVSVEPEQVRVGDELTLTLQVVRDGRGSAPEPEVPRSVSENFAVSGCSTQQGSQTQFLGTRVRMLKTRSKTCGLVARKEGRFKLAFTASDGADQVASNVVEVVVGAPAEVPVAAEAGSRPERAYGAAFLWASLDRDEVYVGQQVVYQLEFYAASDRRFRAFVKTMPSFGEFMFSHELPSVERRVEEVEGQLYSVETVSRRGLIASTVGTFEVGAAEVELRRQGTVRSSPVSVRVRPLPAEGQPPGFSPNNVGRYTIAAEIDRTELSVGEPATLRVTLRGDGNIDIVDPGPWATVEGLRRYDPKTNTTRSRDGSLGGEREYEFLVIPQRSGTITIPAHVFHFFDPEDEAYRSVRTEPIALHVEGADTGDVAEAEPPPSEVSPASGLRASLMPVIVAPKLPRKLPTERWLTPRRWSYGMMAVPILLALGAGGRAGWRRFGPDESAREHARRRARRRALSDQAAAAVEGGRDFHGVLGTLLQELALERAGPAGVGLPRHRLMDLLARRGVPREALDRLEGLLEACDAARFGAQAGGASDRRKLLEQATALMHGGLR